MSREAIISAVHDNLRNLGLNYLEIVNMRSTNRHDMPGEGSIVASFEAFADLQRTGLVRYIGLTSVTPREIGEGQEICEIACV